MEKQIDNFKAQKRQWRFWGALALPFLGLLALLLFMVNQSQQTQRNLHDLTQEVQLLRAEKPPVLPNLDSLRSRGVLKNDTVYHHIIVRRYDTIFQTIVQRTLSEAMPNKRNFSEGIPTEKINNSNNIILDKGKQDVKTATTLVKTSETLVVQPKNIRENTENQDKVTVLGNNEPIIKKADTSQTITPLSISIENDSIKTISTITSTKNPTEKNDTSQTATPLDAFSITTTGRGSILEKDSIKTTSKISSKENDIEKPDTVATATPLSISTEKTEKTAEKHKWMPILKPIKLSGYEIGLLGGAAFIGNDDVVRQTGYIIGARGTIGLGERFKIVGDAQYLALGYDVDKITGQHDIPTINPPTPNDELKEIKIEQPAFHFGLGLQYDLTRNRLRPFVGISAIGELKLEEKFDFQFTNRLTQEDVSVRTKRNENSFNLPYLRLNTGIAYPVFKTLKLQLEGSYDIPFDNKKAFQPLWQVKGGVLYRF